MTVVLLLHSNTKKYKLMKRKDKTIIKINIIQLYRGGTFY